MKGVKRKTEQPTLTAFGFTKKVTHNGDPLILILSKKILVYQMCRIAIMLTLCLTFRVFLP